MSTAQRVLAHLPSSEASRIDAAIQLLAGVEAATEALQWLQQHLGKPDRVKPWGGTAGELDWTKPKIKAIDMVSLSYDPQDGDTVAITMYGQVNPAGSSDSPWDLYVEDKTAQGLKSKLKRALRGRYLGPEIIKGLGL